MINFKPMGVNSTSFNKKVSLNELGTIDAGSFFILLAGKTLLFIGVILIFLNNFGVVAPGSYFGKFSWVTLIVFIIGIILNFVFIPILYVSSFKNFKRDNFFWDNQTFWMLPLFFFGIFFLKGAEISFASEMFILSIIVVALVHANFIYEARKFLFNDLEVKFADYNQYFVTLKYLTVYYLIVILTLIICNPLEYMFSWFRLAM